MAEQPAHPNRGFGDKEQVHKNWSGMFESFPDLEVLRQSTEGDVVWSEWHWSATGLQMAGVTVMGIREDLLGACTWSPSNMKTRRTTSNPPVPSSWSRRPQSTSASKPCSPERSASLDSTSSAESSGT